MFGKNVITKQEKRENYNNSMPIKEIFYSFQGEGIFSGYPATFIRFGNCCLKCTFCDTDFSTDLNYMTVDEILKSTDFNPAVNLVVITGGEPFINYGLIDLTKELLELGHLVQIETSGTVYYDEFDELIEHPNLFIMCSPKTGKVHSQINEYAVAFKYVIKSNELSEEDGLPIFSTQVKDRPLKIARPEGNKLIFVSPCDEYDESKNVANIEAARVSALTYGYVFNFQLHKLLCMR